ncbi:hypothetical protein [Zavarzinella formosa]|uniref:hypothetical protein n=1 Tax=Zavarzinella formosa TaxID=360055 RepID=UPI0002D96765|nr:hypothetical protein [Zavarzinella formosa]
MRHVVRLLSMAILGILAAGPVSAQPPRPKILDQLKPLPPGVFLPPPEGVEIGRQSHDPQPGEQDVDDLRGWLDGTLKPRGKSKPVDPKMLEDLLSKLKDGNQGLDPRELENLLKNNPQFKNPDFLKSLEKMRGEGDFPRNLKRPIRENNGDPRIVDRIPDLDNKLGNFVDQAKKADPNVGGIPDGKVPDAGANGDASKIPDMNAGQNRPKLDPSTQEWIKWMEKNLGDSPTGQQALKEMIEAMGKGDLKGVFDDLPEFKNGEWKDINDWGKGTLGDNWKFSPPDWNFSGGGSGPSFGGGGSGLNFGGGPSVGSIGPGSAEGAGGGLSVVAIIIGVIGAAFLAYILYNKWVREQEARQTMIAASQHKLDLTRIRTREELVEAFDTLTVEKLGDESRNWNHRVVTETFADNKPEVAEPVQELGELYQKARYAPPQDDLTQGELSTAERDLRTVAGVNP